MYSQFKLFLKELKEERNELYAINEKVMFVEKTDLLKNIDLSINPSLKEKLNLQHLKLEQENKHLLEQSEKK